MLSVVLFAGNNTAKLAEFFEQRGTFDVQFRGNNLSDNYEELSKNIIKCDKFIYIFRNEGMSIRDDMHALQRLIEDSGFFKPKEYVFLCEDNDISDNAKKYFLSVMNDCKIKDYVVSSLDKHATFTYIYNSLIGTSSSVNFENTYRPLYKRERMSKATIQYEAEYDEDLVVEAVDYSGVNQYEKSKNMTDKLDGSDMLVDSDFWIYPDKFLNVGIGTLKNVDMTKHIMCVIGEQNIGKSVWASAIAKTAIDDGWCTQIYDFSVSKSMSKWLDVEEVNPIDVIRGVDVENYLCCADVDLFPKAINNIDAGKHLGIFLFEQKDFPVDILHILNPICVWITKSNMADLKKISIMSQRDIIVLSEEGDVPAKDVKDMFGCKVANNFKFETAGDIPRLFYRFVR